MVQLLIYDDSKSNTPEQTAFGGLPVKRMKDTFE